MKAIEIFLIGIGLSADAFAISISNGLCMKKLIIKKAFLIALMFGFFQALMPFLGFIFGSAVSSIITWYAPFVAFALLGFIGGGGWSLMDWLKNEKSNQKKVAKIFL